MRYLAQLGLVTVLSLVSETGLFAQSLADVAKAEAARRKGTNAPVKVYTNDDLGAAGAAAPVPPLATPAPSPAAQTPADSKDQKQPVDEKKTEKYWKDRAVSIQQSLSRNKLLLEALQSQVNGLNAEFLNTDDPGQRALLEKKIQTASSEMQRVQQDIEKQKQAATTLEDEARKAGVPSGWIR